MEFVIFQIKNDIINMGRLPRKNKGNWLGKGNEKRGPKSENLLTTIEKTPQMARGTLIVSICLNEEKWE